jgi:hypothetical protein
MSSLFRRIFRSIERTHLHLSLLQQLKTINDLKFLSGSQIASLSMVMYDLCYVESRNGGLKPLVVSYQSVSTLSFTSSWERRGSADTKGVQGRVSTGTYHRGHEALAMVTLLYWHPAVIVYC